MKLTQTSPFGKLLRHTARPGASALGRFMLWGAEELSELLVAAGFSQPAVHRKSASANSWICLVAERGKA